MMVIDSSAIIAIFLEEPESAPLAECIATAKEIAISAVNYVETSIVLCTRTSSDATLELDAFLQNTGIGVAAVTADHAMLARTAYLSFGKGRHPAQLNICDCFAYALAKALNAPLLFKGTDFSKTDITPALL